MNDTLCWNCNKPYPIVEPQCPHCCASNANEDLESAQAEEKDKSKIDHDWEFQDDSFDHAFGTERVHYYCCQRCGATKATEVGDYGDDCWGADDGL
jgi:hypothetical protein